jgi:hypothetical protein
MTPADGFAGVTVSPLRRNMNQKAKNLTTLMKVAGEILQMMPKECEFDINIFTDTESMVIFLFDKPYSIILSNQILIRVRDKSVVNFTEHSCEVLDYADPQLFDKIKLRCFT